MFSALHASNAMINSTTAERPSRWTAAERSMALAVQEEVDMSGGEDVTAADIRSLLYSHVQVGPMKAVSYLPLRTVSHLLKMNLEEYENLVIKNGGICMVFSEGDTCISSGAIYAYRERDLQAILDRHSSLLITQSWPTTAEHFVRAIAANWLPLDHPITEVIRECFGEVRGVGK